jgi:sulfite reductase (NADPH) flavoprotein alpha-component
MTIAPPDKPMMLIPDNAPFSADQRAWLSGFLAAALSLDATGATALSATEARAALPAGAAGPELATNDDAPWHDPAMAIGDRMALAQGKPIAPRLMAAMAQQDCGQCGYNCADYANAIALKTEARLNLCVPGGKETARLVKALADEAARDTATTSVPAQATPPEAAANAVAGVVAGRSRDLPASAIFIGRRRLNGEGSAKETYHVDFDISAGGLDYVVGDSFGIFPRNDLGLADQVIAMLGASHTTPVRDRTLRDILIEEVSLGLAPDSLYELFTFISGGAVRQKARALAQGDDPDGDAGTLDVLGVLHKFSNVRPHPEAFIEALEPLQPRLYSISSSPREQAGQVSLTVDAVAYTIGKRRRVGAASTYLGHRAKPGESVRAYVQAAHNFALPADPATAIIMIGPGTGIAPFRAFLAERRATKAKGRNWLFFGHQRAATDFFYKQELETLKRERVLTRLSLAWSRDGAQKFYVQDRMREAGADLWQWLAAGAHVYVCGDAKRMAKDVEAALVDIAAAHGARSTDEAVAFVAGLKKSGRYQADVY